MHSVSFSKTGGPEVLEYKALKLEDPKIGEVLIKHSAIAVSYTHLTLPTTPYV